MEQQRCPNCGAKWQQTDEKCSKCNWIPLQSTELVFLDVERLECPHCRRTRSISEACCPHCGAQGLLRGEATDVATFRLSSLLLLTAWIGVCITLTRVVPPVGVIISVISTLVLIRCSALICERKRHRYPVALHDLGRFVGSSLLGVLVGGMAFLGTFAIEMMLISVLTMGIFSAMRSPREALLGVAIPLTLVHACVIRMVWSRTSNRSPLIRSSLLAFTCSAVVIMASTLTSFWWMFALVLVWVPIGSVVVMACRRNECSQLAANIVGCSAGMWPLGVLVGVVEPGRTFDAAIALCGFSLLMMPSLLTLFLLQSVWSWDDAFASRWIPPGAQYSPARPRRRPSIILWNEDDEGIEFPDVGTVEPSTDNADASSVTKQASKEIEI